MIFRGFRYAAFQWHAFHSNPPLTNREYDTRLSSFGISTMVDPRDGNFERYGNESASKSRMWPWMVYVREEPDWHVVRGGTRLIRLMRIIRKSLPWSRWYSAKELGVGGIMTFVGGKFRPWVKKKQQ